MTGTEEALMIILKWLKVEKNTAMGIILMLEKKENGAKLLIDFLKNSNPEKLTKSMIIKEATRIAKEAIN